MPLSVVIASCLVAAAVPFLLWSLLPSHGRSDRDVRANLRRGLNDSLDGAVARQQSNFGARLVLPANRIKLDKLLALAGRPPQWPLSRVLLAKPLLAVVAAVVGSLLLSAATGTAMLVMVLFLVALAYFIPDLLIYSRGMERQTAIALELPDTLDQMLIAVEAGLGFEAAMARAGKGGKGPLAGELIRTLQDMRVGMSRREAYQSLSERSTVPELRAFIRAVVQADTYGISISTVLRTQAKEMRLKRRQRAEEKAMQIPVKVLFPLMLFILPVLFIAVLGPTVITMMASFQ
ncbi:MAG: type II secretion system F family protein [Microbacteriaceae bacterium]|nr:type II secretion system F family protein [Microbacteriaceae bacterium]